MKPGRHPELVALGFAHAEVGIGAAVGLHGLVQQHLRQLRYAFAVAAGVGTLGIDGIGQQLDHGIQQALLGFDQLACLDGHGGSAGQLLDKAPERFVHFIARLLILQLQHQNAEQRLATVIEHHREAVPL
ncbi:hypothetical protein D3C78_582080 [compost metagenome]